MNQISPILGIDLGTTRSVAAYVGSSGHVTCLPDRDGEVLTPSCILIDADGTAAVGREARAAMAGNPDRVVAGFKRHMGQVSWSFNAGSKTYSAPALSAILLRRLVEDAERIVGHIGGAVITVPAYFGDRERTATLEAAAIARLPVLDLINEPTAAALASAFDAYIAAGGDGSDLSKVAIASTAPAINVICDLGGGTFDVTVIRVAGEDFEILASGGMRLGGRDFDECIVEAMCKHLFDSNAPDPHHDHRAKTGMRLEAERAKHILTVKNKASIPAPYDRIPDMVLTRERFEEMSSGLIERLREMIRSVMNDAGLTWNHVEDLLVIGGASRMPMFKRMAGEVSRMTPSVRLQPDLIVAQGAAVFGAILQVQGEQTAVESSRCDVDGEDFEDEMLDDPSGERSSEPLEHVSASAEAEDVFSSRFDPGFVAAAGSVRLHDVTSQGLGVIVRSPREDRKVNVVLIPRNARLPAKRARVFATRKHDQRRVSIPIIEGDKRDPSSCVEIGRCIIDPLPPGLPKGSPVQVTFSYDKSGRMCIRAEELASRTRAETVLERYSASSRGEIDQLAKAVAQLSLR